MAAITYMVATVLLVLLAAHVLAVDGACGYESCPKSVPGAINVHLVAHTHDDVGWLKTVDQYYYGARNNLQQAGVQYILDSVVYELSQDPQRRFIYVETAFFKQWWDEQDDKSRQLVRNLVAQGRLEFINGGWCMNDEATAHYVDIIDQMALGLGILNETFGECGRPRVAWQIDPFGHSREQASLLAQMGYDGLFFGRIDHDDKALRQRQRNMEMLWKGNPAIGDEAGSIFSGVLHNLYMNPPGFCFDIVCDDEPIVDNYQSSDYNVDERVTAFLDYCRRASETYATDNLLVTMGGDFTYMDANLWYKNMDKLIKYANERQANGSRFNLFYSSPSCYLKELNAAGHTWPSKIDDFFPYASDSHSYWTGYFTSRPSLKFMVRQASNLLQTCKQMTTWLQLTGTPMGSGLSLLREAVAVAQHHDAVSGTEKQHVANDYARRLHQGVTEGHKIIASYFKNKLKANVDGARVRTTPLPELPPMQFCPLLNMSQCPEFESNGQSVVHVYNPLSKTVDRFVRLPVTDGGFQVLDPKGKLLESQLVPIAAGVRRIPGRQSNATHELVFLAEQLPPVGFKSYMVRRVARGFSGSKHWRSSNTLHAAKADIVISNKDVIVIVDGVSGLLKSVSVDGATTPLEQQFLWYRAAAGDNRKAENRSSGAYIFRPNGTEALPVFMSRVTAVYNGPLVQEIHQAVGPWISQVIRLYSGQRHVELDWLVGPLPVWDGIGKEVISRFTTPIDSAGIFYTDANGRQDVQRERNQRQTWPFDPSAEPVSSNYYPINTHIYLRSSTDPKRQLGVVIDRAQGGSSLKDGQLELMLHRRLLYDDAFGVEEALNEVAFDGAGVVVRGTHYIITDDTTRDAGRLAAQAMYRREQISFMNTDMDWTDWINTYRTLGQSVKQSLADAVNLMTLEQRTDGSVLVRLEHVLQYGEAVAVDIADIFPGFNVRSIRETMLAGNQWADQSSRLRWISDRGPIEMDILKQHDVIPSRQKFIHVRTGKGILKTKATTIQLAPMQIRTLVVELERNE